MPLPTPADLQSNPNYRLLLALPQNDLMPFIREYYFGKRTWITLAHVGLITVLIIAWLLWGIQQGNSSQEWLNHFGLSIIGFAVLIPIHELLHAAAYRGMGAPRVTFESSLRKLYIYAAAPDFAISGGNLAWVALIPFIEINAGLVLAMILLPAHRHVLLTILLLHTGGAHGDFALVSYLWLNRKRGLISYDDAEAHISYFYEEVARAEHHPAPMH